MNRTQQTPGPAVIKVFESENELKCKDRLCDFCIKAMFIFKKIEKTI